MRELPTQHNTLTINNTSNIVIEDGSLVIGTETDRSQKFTLNQILNSTIDESDRKFTISNKAGQTVCYEFSNRYYNYVLSAIEEIKKKTAEGVKLIPVAILQDGGKNIKVRLPTGRDQIFSCEQLMQADFRPDIQTLLISDGRLTYGYKLNDQLIKSLVVIIQKLKAGEGELGIGEDPETEGVIKYDVVNVVVLEGALLFNFHMKGTGGQLGQIQLGFNLRSRCKLDGNVLTYQRSRSGTREFTISNTDLRVVKAFIAGNKEGMKEKEMIAVRDVSAQFHEGEWCLLLYLENGGQDALPLSRSQLCKYNGKKRELSYPSRNKQKGTVKYAIPKKEGCVPLTEAFMAGNQSVLEKHIKWLYGSRAN